MSQKSNKPCVEPALPNMQGVPPKRSNASLIPASPQWQIEVLVLLDICSKGPHASHKGTSGTFALNEPLSPVTLDELSCPAAAGCAGHDKERYPHIGGRRRAGHHNWREWRLGAPRCTQERALHLAGQAFWQGDHYGSASRHAYSLISQISEFSNGPACSGQAADHRRRTSPLCMQR